MIPFLRNNYEKLLLTAALGLLLASTVWSWSARPRGVITRRRVSGALPDGLIYQPAGLPPPNDPGPKWSEPATQAGKAGWVYELFTPPAVYFNPLTSSFGVVPPGDPVAASLPASDARNSVKLLEVRREPFRLQLLGYFGVPGDYTGMFVSPGRSETLLARAGRRIPQVGLFLKDLTVKKIPVEPGDRWPVYDTTAVATLQDEQSGAEIRLESRTPKLTDTLVAVLRCAPDQTELLELHVGDAFSGEQARYRVERLQLDPPEVLLAKLMPGQAVSETQVLRPEADEDELLPESPGPNSKPAGPRNAGLASADTDK